MLVTAGVLGSFNLHLPECAVTRLKCGWKVAPFGFSSHVEELISTVSGGGTPSCPARPITAEISAQQRLVPAHGEEPRGMVAAPSALGRDVSPSLRLSQCSPLWGTWRDTGAEHLGTVPDLAGEEAKQQKRDQHGLGSTFYNHNNFCCCGCFPMCKSKDFSAKKVLLGSLLILQ